MTVAELIAILQNVNPAAEVIIGVNDDEFAAGGIFEPVVEVDSESDPDSYVQLNTWVDIADYEG